MNEGRNVSLVSTPPLDMKDPRIRITFADVAMRVARDGPMYGVILLVGVLALKGTTTALESILGAAFALQARSHPPPETDKLGRTIINGAVLMLAVLGLLTAISACQ